VKSFLFLFLFTLLISCNNDKSRLLQKEKFVEVLIEYHLVDGIAQTQMLGSAVPPNDSVALMDSILMLKKIDKKIFQNTLSYYSQHLKEFSKVYDDVLSQISQRETKNLEEETKANSKP